MDALTRRALLGVVQFQTGLAALIFLPALTLSFWQGWLFWVVMGVSVLAITLWLAARDPVLLQARIGAGPPAEARVRQKLIQSLTGPIVALEVALPGVCHLLRLGQVTAPVTLAANLAVALGMAAIARVFAANGTAHASIRITAGQRVVTTGPYGVVRHPMYGVAALMFLVLPLALGAWPPMVLAPVLGWLMGLRALDEEAMLRAELPGYADYAAKRRWRMIPGLW